MREWATQQQHIRFYIMLHFDVTVYVYVIWTSTNHTSTATLGKPQTPRCTSGLEDHLAIPQNTLVPGSRWAPLTTKCLVCSSDCRVLMQCFVHRVGLIRIRKELYSGRASFHQCIGPGWGLWNRIQQSHHILHCHTMPYIVRCENSALAHNTMPSTLKLSPHVYANTKCKQPTTTVLTSCTRAR